MVSAEVQDKIREFEGLSLKPYKDVAGNLTVGYGHLTKSTYPITKETAETLFCEDLSVAEQSTLRILAKEHPEVIYERYEIDALVSFTFNLGSGNLQKLVRNRSKEEIANAIPLYNKAGGKVVSGLTKRREWEKEWFLKGCKEPQYVRLDSINFIIKAHVPILENPFPDSKVIITYDMPVYVKLVESKIYDGKYVHTNRGYVELAGFYDQIVKE